MRVVVLDTETTGLNRSSDNDVCHGHRIVEIAVVEIIDGEITDRHFHRYLNPEVKISMKAAMLHGLNDEFLSDKEKFHEIVGDLIEFIAGDEIVIHNASFDISFLHQEFQLMHDQSVLRDQVFKVIDTLHMARKRFPYEDNSLVGLCKRFNLPYDSNHCALTDALMLARVYLMFC